MLYLPFLAPFIYSSEPMRKVHLSCLDNSNCLMFYTAPFAEVQKHRNVIGSDSDLVMD